MDEDPRGQLDTSLKGKDLEVDAQRCGFRRDAITDVFDQVATCYLTQEREDEFDAE